MSYQHTQFFFRLFLSYHVRNQNLMIALKINHPYHHVDNQTKTYFGIKLTFREN